MSGGNSKTYTQRELLQCIGDSDQEAFAYLFSIYRDSVYAVAWRMTESTVEAEEVVQDVFVKLWVNRHKLTDIENLEAYIYTMARNFTYEALRRFARINRLVAKEGAEEYTLPEAERILQEKELEQVIYAAVNQLPPQQKVVYLLSRNEGLTKAEIAAQLGISPNTVKSHYEKAVRSVRAHCTSFLKILLVIASTR